MVVVVVGVVDIDLCCQPQQHLVRVRISLVLAPHHIPITIVRSMSRDSEMQGAAGARLAGLITQRVACARDSRLTSGWLLLEDLESPPLVPDVFDHWLAALSVILALASPMSHGRALDVEP